MSEKHLAVQSWSVACSFLYLATQLPTVWGTRSYDEATEEMVRSFSMTSRTTWALNSSEYLAAGIVFILSTHGKKNSPSPRNTTHPTKSDLRARPIYHHLRQSIEAHLTIVTAALAMARWLETTTDWSIRRLITTARRYRTITINIAGHTLTAADPLPPDLTQTLHNIHHDTK